MADDGIFSDELIGILEDKKYLNKSAELFKRVIDGEPKNVDPLTEIPESKMRLYGYSGLFHSEYFDTEEELIEYVRTHDTSFGNICIVDYLGRCAGRKDVIRRTYRSGKSVMYAACDEDGYGIYNNERSIYRGEFVWEYNHGHIREMFSAFRDRGIEFENDIYAEIDARNRELYLMMEETLNKWKQEDNAKRPYPIVRETKPDASQLPSINGPRLDLKI